MKKFVFFVVLLSLSVFVFSCLKAMNHQNLEQLNLL